MPFVVNKYLAVLDAQVPDGKGQRGHLLGLPVLTGAVHGGHAGRAGGGAGTRVQGEHTPGLGGAGRWGRERGADVTEGRLEGAQGPRVPCKCRAEALAG